MKKEIYLLIGLIAIFSLVSVLLVEAAAGTLESVTMTPSVSYAGNPSDYTAAFTLASSTPSTAQVKLIFPSGFNTASVATTTTLTGFGGIMATSTSAASGTTQVVTLFRADGTDTAAATAVTLAVTGIVNHFTGGSYTMDVETLYLAGDTLEIGTSAAFTITSVPGPSITKKSYTVEFSADPSGGGTVPNDESFGEGTIVIVNAVPKSGYDFVAWEENGVEISKSSNFSFIANANRDLVARFKAVETGGIAEAPTETPTETTLTTIEQIKAKIVEVQQKIIDLLQQLIQLIQQQIQQQI